MSSEKKWTVVGVSGVTCGGKTTFAEALQAEFPGAIVIHQDSYFLPPDDPRHTKLPDLNHVNWEIATALDMDQMVDDIQEILARPTVETEPLLILEGYLIFTDRLVSSLCDLKYFFFLSPEESKVRRASRKQGPPDPSWESAWHDVPGYFEDVVWPEYERNFQVALCINDDLQLVDGRRPTRSVVDQVSVVIEQELKKRKDVVGDS